MLHDTTCLRCFTVLAYSCMNKSHSQLYREPQNLMRYLSQSFPIYKCFFLLLYDLYINDKFEHLLMLYVEGIAHVVAFGNKRRKDMYEMCQGKAQHTLLHIMLRYDKNETRSLRDWTMHK